MKKFPSNSRPRMMRRLLAWTIVTVFGAWVGHAESKPRPNILWLIAEDFSPHLGCYGTEQVWTPHLDRLAAQGMRFTRAFTTSPVCSASRSAFMTGMYQTTIGAHHHRSNRDGHHPLPEGVRVLPAWMRDLGYFTANLEEFPPEVDLDRGGKTDWNFTVAEPVFDSSRWGDLEANQPFFAQVNFKETHRDGAYMRETGVPFKAPRRADRAKVEIPPYYPDVPEVREDWALYLDDASELDDKVGRVLAQLEAEGLAENTVVVFMGDHGQAHVRGKQWCYDSGLQIPLIIFWPPSIPAPVGYDPGTVSDRMIEAIDLAPTILAWAGAPAKPTAMQGQAFQGAWREAPRRYAFGARDRCDETVLRIRTVRDERYRYIRNFMPERPFLQLNRYKENMYPMIAVMRRLHEQGKLNAVQAALMAPRRPAEELYDTAADPHETVNLATSRDPAHQEALVRLRAELADWVERTDDQGRFPESPDAVADATRKAQAASRSRFGRTFETTDG